MLQYPRENGVKQEGFKMVPLVTQSLLSAQWKGESHLISLRGQLAMVTLNINTHCSQSLNIKLKITTTNKHFYVVTIAHSSATSSMAFS